MKLIYACALALSLFAAAFDSFATGPSAGTPAPATAAPVCSHAR